MGPSLGIWLAIILALFGGPSSSSSSTINAIEPAIVFSNPVDEAAQLNDAPIVGVLTQEISYHLNGKWPGVFKSYIAASYVKFVEGAGGRVVPIWIGQPKSYYEEMLSKVNGVLWPGGATWFNQSNGYSEAGKYIYDIASTMNDRGEYMPIFGTCLGFELLAYVSSNRGDPRCDCSSDRQSLHLEFEPDFKTSKFFGNAPDDVIQILATEQVTPNFHHFCLTKENLTAFGLDDDWRVLSVNDDEYGLEFVSTMEHRRYPYYGVQFHPEKNLYEWIINRNISHTSTAIRAAQYFGNFFIDETRRSQNRFAGGVEEENRVLIYNYPTNFTALVKSAYEQCYLFDENVSYRKEVDVPTKGDGGDENDLPDGVHNNNDGEPGTAACNRISIILTFLVAALTIF